MNRAERQTKLTADPRHSTLIGNIGGAGEQKPTEANEENDEIMAGKIRENGLKRPER